MMVPLFLFTDAFRFESKSIRIVFIEAANTQSLVLSAFDYGVTMLNQKSKVAGRLRIPVSMLRCPTNRTAIRMNGCSVLVGGGSPLHHHALGFGFDVHIGLALDRYRNALDLTIGELARSIV